MSSGDYTTCRKCHKAKKVDASGLCKSCYELIKYAQPTYSISLNTRLSNAGAIRRTILDYEGSLPQWET